MSSTRSEGRRTLRRGFTTGACAAAAAKGAALMLRDGKRVQAVDLELPAGFSHRFELHGQRWDENSAHCYVIKDAGDDPDVTHGVGVHAEVRLDPPSPQPFPTRGEGERDSPPSSAGGGRGEGETQVVIEGGPGIGKVTKPGLAVPVGEWAINPVPRQMIAEAVLEVLAVCHSSALARGASAERPPTPHVTLSVPDGAERAKRTLNERLGIVGGLSILGTSGVVEPISHRAWTDTLEVALDVALATGCGTVVLSTGRTSEKAAQEFLRPSPPPSMGGGGGEGGRGGDEKVRLPEEAFVMMGDHVGYALGACHRKGAAGIVLAVQFAKMAKIACGHPQTHVRSSRLDLQRLADWARAIGLDGSTAEKIECANTAREVLELLGPENPLVGEVAARAMVHLQGWAPGAAIVILLVDYQGEIAGRFGKSLGLQG